MEWVTVYGFSYDGGEFCFLSRQDMADGIAKERQEQGELPGFTNWESAVPEEVLVQAAYDYLVGVGDFQGV